MTAASAGTAEDGGGEPRLAEAATLISDPKGYDRAVALYREILAGDPDASDATEARMWLARVLAWQGSYDASLDEYRVFTRAPDPPRWAAIEEAEVLSWAGRSAEAEAAFRALLERDPGDARAARGLARVYAWSNRPTLADAAYARALALEEDAEARRELESLRAQRGWELAAESDFSSDSDGFSQLYSRARAGFDLGYETRLLARSGSLWIDMDRDGTPPAGLAGDADDVAFEGWLGVERRFGELTARVELGGRRWRDSPDHFLASAALELPVRTGAVLTFGVEHGDFLARSTSLDAVREGIRDTTLRLAAWQPLPHQLALYAWGEASLLDDSNERLASGLSLDYTPLEGRDVTLSLFASHLGYTGHSRFYYDPDVDSSGGVSLRGEHELVEGLAFEISGRVGLGYARQDGADGFGFTWGVGGGPTWRPGQGWWLALRGRTSESQRSSSYAIHGASLSLGKAF